MDSLKMPTLETERLLLRPIQLQDAADMFSYASDSETVRFLTFPKHQSIEESTRVIHDIFLTRVDRGIPEAYALVHKESGRMIGTCDIVKFVEGEYAEIGYVINPNYQNKGLMTEACLAVIGITFKKFAIQKIQIQHDVENIASQRVIEKCGFIFQENRTIILNDSSQTPVKTRYYTINREQYAGKENYHEKGISKSLSTQRS